MAGALYIKSSGLTSYIDLNIPVVICFLGLKKNSIFASLILLLRKRITEK